MPKTKSKTVTAPEETKDETKEILLDDEEKVVDPELVAGDPLLEEEEENDEVLALDEVDPFQDKYEE